MENIVLFLLNTSLNIVHKIRTLAMNLNHAFSPNLIYGLILSCYTIVLRIPKVFERASYFLIKLNGKNIVSEPSHP